MSSTLRYILYARKSTDREDHQVSSLEDQLSVLKAVAKRDHLRVSKVVQEARSAKRPGSRPGFAECLGFIEQGEADAILCWHINRLSRNPVDSGQVQWMLQQGTIQEIRTPDRSYRPEDNALLMAVETGMANQYVRDLATDVHRGVSEKAAKGWYPYRSKHGYRVDPETKQIEPDPQTFELLKRAWCLLATGAFTVPQVGTQLFTWGFRVHGNRTRTRKAVSRSALYRIFSDPFYMGTFTYNGESFSGRHEAMVSRAEFEKVQSLLGRANHIQPKTKEFAFTGFIRCGVCGCLITAQEKTKHYKTTGNTRTYTYYHCTGRRGCVRSSVSESYIDSRIAHWFKSCQLDSRLSEWVRESLAELPNLELDSKEHASSEKSRLLERLDAVYEMRESRELSAEEFADRKYHYRSQIVALEALETRDQTEREARRLAANERLREAPTAYDRFSSTKEVHVKRYLTSLLADSYVLTQGKLEIVPHPVFDRIRTLEPSRNGPEQSREDPSGPDSSAWRRGRDKITTWVSNG
jgi:site-specific DNA recombinase